MKLDITRCDKHGPLVSPQLAKQPLSDDDGKNVNSDVDSSYDKGNHHEPNKLVIMGVANALSSIVFLIMLVIMAKCC